jgi:Concanavalin A-like lectin/glucanases superfamily
MSCSRPSSRHARPRGNPFAALAAVAALCTGLSMAALSAHEQADARRAAADTLRSASPPISRTAAPTSPGTVPHAAASRTAPHGANPVKAGAGAAATVVAAESVAVRYTFDDGAGHPILATNGRYPLRIATAAGGAIGFVSRGAGWAVRFPRRCTAGPSACPRAILQGERVDALNPGTRPLRFGASVRMTSADTADGANVVQKGYSVGGYTQFKLQVDGKAGRPSCVIASATRIYRIVAAVSVADGHWRDVACVRSGSRLGITVDGNARGSTYVPASLSIVNSEPLRVGGKGTSPGNDQFAGQIDDVFLTIS